MNEIEYCVRWVCGKCTKSCYSCDRSRPQHCTGDKNIEPFWTRFRNAGRA